MNSIQKIKRTIEIADPAVSAELTIPDNKQNSWWLDLRVDDYFLVVEWRPSEGFGLSAIGSDDCGFGGPDEVYSDFDQACARILELVKNRANTIPPIIPEPLPKKKTAPPVRAGGKSAGKRASVA
jgi:hypothetical protein